MEFWPDLYEATIPEFLIKKREYLQKFNWS